MVPLNNTLHRDAYELSMNLLSLVSTGFKGYEYMNKREVIVAKLAEYGSETLEISVHRTCTEMLQVLNCLKDSYTCNDIESQIDLITFNVMDLLRCKCVGSKHDILRIYEQLQTRSDYFEIIRVKNKLNEGTRDILINLKLKKSFLVVEVQLALGKSQ
jgi:hypothetical protein